MTRNKIFGVNLLVLALVAPLFIQVALVVGVVAGVVWLLTPRSKFVYLDCTGEEELILTMRALCAIGVFQDSEWWLWRSQNVQEWGEGVCKPHPSDGRRTNVYDGLRRFEVRVTRAQQVALKS